MRKIRAVLIEDETMFRQLILLTLGKVKGLSVVGEFGLGKPGLQFCLREKPDMLVVDPSAKPAGALILVYRSITPNRTACRPSS